MLCKDEGPVTMSKALKGEHHSKTECSETHVIYLFLLYFSGDVDLWMQNAVFYNLSRV